MIKKLTAFFLLTLIVSIWFYIAGAVTSASFNIGQWDETARRVIATFWIISGIPCGVIAVNIDDIIK